MPIAAKRKKIVAKVLRRVIGVKNVRGGSIKTH